MSTLVNRLLKVELFVLFRELNENLSTALTHIEVCFDALVVTTL